MPNTEFTILLTPPLAITADDHWEKEVFYGNFPHKFQRKLRSDDVKDQERKKKFKGKGEWVAFTFAVPENMIKFAYQDIAKEICNNEKFSKALERESFSEIFVEGSNDSAVISLHTNAERLAEQIRQIVEK
jgi:hypothetical protein